MGLAPNPKLRSGFHPSLLLLWMNLKSSTWWRSRSPPPPRSYHLDSNGDRHVPAPVASLGRSQTLVNTSMLILNSLVSNTNFNIFRHILAPNSAGFLRIDFHPFQYQSTPKKSNRGFYCTLKNKHSLTQLPAKMNSAKTDFLYDEIIHRAERQSCD